MGKLPVARCNSPIRATGTHHRKGIGLIFPNRDEDKASHKGAGGGNASELGDAGGDPGKSSLFFLTSC